MKGGIFQPSTETGKSFRGAVTLNTPSEGIQVPFSPVMVSIRLVSRAPSADNAYNADTPEMMTVVFAFIVFIQ
ncbi:MAG: hypothetical protein AB1813_12290 [Verrucomicrobiota bacterium]